MRDRRFMLSQIHSNRHETTDTKWRHDQCFKVFLLRGRLDFAKRAACGVPT